MNDSELTKLCADAMRITVVEDGPQSEPPENWLYQADGEWKHYDPLNDDAQAMALVKKFELEIGWYRDGRASVNFHNVEGPNWVDGDTLNRAICECAAKMQKEKA